MTWELDQKVLLIHTTSPFHQAGMIAIITKVDNGYLGWTIPGCRCSHQSLGGGCNGIGRSKGWENKYIRSLDDLAQPNRFGRLFTE